jgi:hypothetical protein
LFNYLKRYALNIVSTVEKFNMKSEAIKVFVGCAPNGEDAESMMVLEYSIKKHCSMPVEIVWMMISDDPNSFWHGWDSSEWGTPFSALRFGIPEYCNFEGQSLYMDSDVMVLADLAELWNLPWTNDTAIVQSRGSWRLCICKFHNERCRNNPAWPRVAQFKRHPTLYGLMLALIGKSKHYRQDFDIAWNNFDGEDNEPLENIKILHYTDMASQPHMKHAIPRLKKQGWAHWYDGEFRPHKRPDVVALFDKLYNEALFMATRLKITQRPLISNIIKHL